MISDIIIKSLQGQRIPASTTTKRFISCQNFCKPFGGVLITVAVSNDILSKLGIATILFVQCWKSLSRRVYSKQSWKPNQYPYIVTLFDINLFRNEKS